MTRTSNYNGTRAGATPTTKSEVIDLIATLGTSNDDERVVKIMRRVVDRDKCAAWSRGNPYANFRYCLACAETLVELFLDDTGKDTGTVEEVEAWLDSPAGRAATDHFDVSGELPVRLRLFVQEAKPEAAS